MRIYFFGPKTERSDLRRTFDAVLQLLRRAGVELSYKTDHLEIGLPKEVVERVDARGGMLLDEMDALVLEGTIPDQELGFFLAHALATRKPTLFLYGGVREQDTLLKYLGGERLPSSLVVKRYTRETLEDVVVAFLRSLGQKEIREIPRIKFTLRITRTIEKYLFYKTHNTDKTKADFIREKLEEMLRDEKSEEWKKFLDKGEE